MAQDAAIGPGARIGDVVVDREIGAGAFGVVWLGRDTIIGRAVVLKVLRAAETEVRPSNRERFLAEARLVGSLKSPHIVTLHHLHTLADGRRALEMEYVDGGSLEELLGGGQRLPVETAARLARGMLVALSHAHAAGVVHGDVKPANVLLAADGAVKLADFGLARALERSGEAESDGFVAGTPQYMAPEVLLGTPPTEASDLWSAGVVLHRMLTGRLPFEADTVGGLFSAIQNATAAPLGADVPAALADLVGACLAKRPEERAFGASRAVEILDAVLAGAPPRALLAAAATPPPAELVGREAEVAAVERALRSVAESTSGAVLLVGGPEGIGKSALLRRGVVAAQGAGFVTVQAAIDPVEGLVRPLLAALRAAVERSGPARSTDATRFGSATPMVRSLLAGDPRSGLEGRQQVVWALVHLLRGLAADRPIALWVDDVHRADPHEIDVLVDLARSLGTTRVLLVLAQRTSGGRDAGSMRLLGELEGATRVALGPLAREAVFALLEEAADGASLDPEVVDWVVRTAEGNPRFAGELFRHLQDVGGVVRVGSRVEKGPAWKTASVPSRLSDLVWRRVASLPASARTILEAAAVDGLEFDGQALAAVIQRPVLSVLRQLQRLSREHALLLPLPSGFRFAHAMLRDLLYQEVAPELRVALHRALAQHLESRGDAVDPERLAIHWERAGEPSRARPHLLAAAASAFARAESLRAVDLLRRAGISPGAVRDEDARARPDLLIALARALARTGAPREEVEAVYEAVLGAADALRDPGLRLRAVVRRAHYHYFRTGFAEGEEAQVRAASDLLPLGEDLGRARYLLGVAATVRGDRDEAFRCLSSADDVFTRIGGADVAHASVLDRLAGLALSAGRLQDAHRLYGESAALSERAGMGINAEASRVNRLWTELMRGSIAPLDAALRTAVRAFTLLRNLELAAHAKAMLAEVRFALGDVEGSASLVADALASLGGKAYLPALRVAHAQQAQISVVRGDLARAEQSLAEARRAAQQRNDAANLAQCEMLAASIRAARGDARGAAEAMDALSAPGRIHEPLVWAELALTTAELAVEGLPAGCVDAVRRRLRDVDAEEALAVPRVVLAGASAWAGEGPTGDLRAAAEALRGERIGLRRAVRRVVGARFAAEAARRDGDAETARREARRALDECRALGYGALEARLGSLLERSSA